MTLGKKLSNYRRLADLTQQQLGDRLNVSAQAVSKWENDLSEPDLATLRKLAALYDVSVDSLLSEEEVMVPADADTLAESVTEAVREQMENMKEEPTVGFCTACGIRVTQENLGAAEPKVLCRACLEAQQKQAEADAAEQARLATQKKAEAMQAECERAAHAKKILFWALFLAVAACAAWIGISIGCMPDNAGAAYIPVQIVIGVLLFLTVPMLFFSEAVQDIVMWGMERSIRFPGIIFSFDLEGLAFLIAVKILFAAIGFLFGVLIFFICLGVCFIVVPFVFIPNIVRAFKECKINEK